MEAVQPFATPAAPAPAPAVTAAKAAAVADGALGDDLAVTASAVCAAMVAWWLDIVPFSMAMVPMLIVIVVELFVWLIRFMSDVISLTARAWISARGRAFCRVSSRSHFSLPYLSVSGDKICTFTVNHLIY